MAFPSKLKTLFKIWLLPICVTLLSACRLDVDILNHRGGTVISNDGFIDCPLNRCAYSYDSQQVAVTLTAIADDGFHFNGFKNPGLCKNGVADSYSTGRCTIDTNWHKRT